MVATKNLKPQSAIEAIVNDTRIAQHAEFPFSNEAEQAVLGSILLDSDMFPLITPIVSTDDFFIPRHQYIYDAMVFVYEEGLGLDILTVTQKLAELGYLKDSGGDAYLAHLISNIPSSQNVESYAQIVQNLSARRMMLKLSEAIKILAVSPSLDTNTLIGRVSEVIDDAAVKVASADAVPISTYVGKVLTEIEEAMNPAKRSYITTGLRALDEMLGGYQRQMVYLIAGRTHNGKSSLGYHSVLAAAQNGKRVALYNTADGDEATIIRLFLAIMTGISTLEFQMGITIVQYRQVVKAAGDLAKLPIFIKSDTNLSPLRLYNHARVLKLKYGLDMIVVDYIQAMTGPAHMSAYERNTAVAESMTKIAKKLNVAVVEMAQINRQGAGGKAPTLDKVEGSGKYEQACQVGIIVHYDGMYDKNAPQDRLSIIVEKNKATGRKGMTHAGFDPHTTKMSDWVETRDISGFLGDDDDD